jgi:dipeptidyl aminopeptidase/acylaminoacyl peptidase
MNPDGTNQTNLTNNGGFNAAPDWSPDGTKIAYYNGAFFCAVSCNIFVMNANGSGQTNLTNSTVPNAFPAWSPDGTKITFQSTRDTAPGQIYSMNSNGSGVTRLTFNSASDTRADWGGVPDAPLHITRITAGANGDRQAAAGVTFTDDDPAGNLSQYSGTISWGDGSTASIPKNQFVNVPSVFGGGFAAGGTHTYASPGTYTVAVTINDVGGASATASTTLVVPSG